VPPRIPDDKRSAILADIKAARKSRAQIGRDHSVSAWTVGNIAKEAHIDGAFSRENTQNATMAAQADSRSMRVAEALAAMSAAPQLRMNVLAAGNGRDAQGWAVAYGIMIDKHAMLEKHDSGTSDAATSLLDAVANGLQVAFDATAGKSDQGAKKVESEH
jgi:hypothetical protein